MLCCVPCLHISNLSHVDLLWFEALRSSALFLWFSSSRVLSLISLYPGIWTYYLLFYVFSNFKCFGKYVTCITIFENSATLNHVSCIFKYCFEGQSARIWNLKVETNSWENLSPSSFDTNQIFHLLHIQIIYTFN